MGSHGGGSRAPDYFETDKSVDAKQVGHLRSLPLQRDTLVAMAYDSRFAIAYVSTSGTSGAQLYRRNLGDTLENVPGLREYHWMAGNFLKYPGPLHPSDLPVDLHELIALCASRPVFIGAGTIKGAGWTAAPLKIQAPGFSTPIQ